MQEGASDPTTGVITPEAKQAVLDLVQSQYPPELINRLDEQIVFNRKLASRTASYSIAFPNAIHCYRTWTRFLQPDSRHSHWRIATCFG